MGRLLKHNGQGAWVNHTQGHNVQPGNQNLTSVPKCDIGQRPADLNQTREWLKPVNFPGRHDEEELFVLELTELSPVQGSTRDSWKV